ncbi:EamA/RhaT family transporter [Ralstonia solanacearum]|nr:EamA/RhaT family transporter [Ralstonia solanacearum]
MSNRTIGYLLLSLAMMTVGSTVIASKLIAGNLPPFPATALRFAVALPFLFALVLLRGQRWPRLSGRGGGGGGVQTGGGCGGGEPGGS